MTFLSFFTRIRIIWITFVTVAIYLQNCSARNSVCITDECIQLGKMYKDNMDQSVKPCKNFYKFACHSFEVKHGNSLFHNYWHSLNIVEEAVSNDLKDLLEGKRFAVEKDIKEAQALYRVCVNTPFLPRSDGTVLRNIMTRIAPWPIIFPKNQQPDITTPLSIIHKMYIKITGESALFNYKILADATDRSRFITKLTRIVSANGMISLVKGWQKAEQDHYLNFLYQVIKEVEPMNLKVPKQLVINDLKQVLEFRDKVRQICKVSNFERSDEMTIKALQEWYDSCAKSRQNAQIKWLDVIRAIYKIDNTRSPMASSRMKVLVNKKYFCKLADLLANTNFRVLVNHIHLYFAERHIYLNQQMEDDLKRSYQEGPQKTGSIVPSTPRWKKCIDDHNMKETLGRMYLNAFFPKRKQMNVANVLKETKRLLSEQISNSTWLSARAKQMSLDKIANMKGVLGQPEWYAITALRPRNIGEELNPIEPQAYYERAENRISVSAACLQLPLCGLELPYAIDYGSILTIFGHEIYHAFDKQGITCDPYGGSKWWPDNVCTEYTKHLKCIKDQYETYRFNEVKKLIFPIPKNLPSTTNEDLADVMGLKLAYLGFKQKLESNGGRCAVLPGFENYSCEKMFFLAFANTHCTSFSGGRKKRSLLEDNHSLPEIRVNGALLNMKEFGAAFSCTADDTMVQKKTCDIWKQQK